MKSWVWFSGRVEMEGKSPYTRALVHPAVNGYCIIYRTKYSKENVRLLFLGNILISWFSAFKNLVQIFLIIFCFWNLDYWYFWTGDLDQQTFTVFHLPRKSPASLRGSGPSYTHSGILNLHTHLMHAHHLSTPKCINSTTIATKGKAPLEQSN